MESFGHILNKWTHFPKHKKRVKIIKLLSIHLFCIKFKSDIILMGEPEDKREDLGITGQSFPSI